MDYGATATLPAMLPGRPRQAAATPATPGVRVDAYVRVGVHALPRPYGVPETVQMPSYTSWQLTHDRATILKTANEDLIFIDEPSLESVTGEFEKRFPAPRPGLSYIGVDSRQTPPKSVAIYDREYYFGKDRQTMFALAKEYGVIPLFDSSATYGLERGGGNEELALKEGCYVRFSEARNQHEVVYDPVVCTRRLKARQVVRIRERVQPITVYEFGKLGRGLQDALLKHVNDVAGYRGSGWGVSRRSMLTWLHTMFTMCVIFYGRKSYRHIPAFQAFLAQWRSRGKTTHSAFKNAKYTSGYERMFEFFDREAKVRKPRTERTLTLRIDEKYLREIG